MTHFLLDAWDGDDDDHDDGDDGDDDGDDGDDDGDDYFDNLFKYHMSSHIGSFTSDHGWKEKSLKLKVETNKSSIVRRTLVNIISQVYLSCCSGEELFHTEIRCSEKQSLLHSDKILLDFKFSFIIRVPFQIHYHLQKVGFKCD